jgi:SAM-dependent methyltransferase
VSFGSIKNCIIFDGAFLMEDLGLRNCFKVCLLLRDMSLVDEVKRKKEFSGLPDSVVLRALRESDDDVKETRKLLRKYFGVFLTNRVLRKGGGKLEVHMSSKKRDYGELYSAIFAGVEDVGSVVDLGCGVNGFSYEYLPEGVEYVGVEAAGQLVDIMNDFFEERGFDGKAICGDLFDVEKVVDVLKSVERSRVVFMFQVVDALESVERNFSLRLIGEVMKECEVLVISVPLVSLGGRKKFAVKRRWLVDYLGMEFDVVRDFEVFGERVFVVKGRGV